MTSKLEGIRNDKVLILYDFEMKTILVQSHNLHTYKCFCGEDIRELYDSFKDFMTDDTDYETALLCFTPPTIN